MFDTGSRVLDTLAAMNLVSLEQVTGPQPTVMTRAEPHRHQRDLRLQQTMEVVR